MRRLAIPVAEGDFTAAGVASPFKDFADASLIDAERLRNVMLRFTKKVPLPDFNGIIEG